MLRAWAILWTVTGGALAMGVGCIPKDFTFEDPPGTTTSDAASSSGAGGAATASGTSSGSTAASTGSGDGSGGSGGAGGLGSSSSASTSGGGGGPGTCGDGTLDALEACDDGNLDDGDTCSSDCRCTAGDGQIAFAGDGSCYVLTGDPHATWEDAEAACKIAGMHLATVTTSAEIALIASYTQERLWIGANDLRLDGEFIWVSGEPWTINPCSSLVAGCDPTVNLWNAGEPNNSSGMEACVTLFYAMLLGFDDAPCSLEEHFLCERAP